MQWNRSGLVLVLDVRSRVELVAAMRALPDVGD